MNKKIKTVCTLSVLLNVFLVGLVIGGFSRDFNQAFDQGISRETNKDFSHEEKIKSRAETELNEFADMLPESERQDFKKSFKKLSDNNEQIRQQIRSIRRDIAIIFNTEPFDEELFHEKTRQMHDLRGKQMHESSEVIAKVAAQMSLEQRKRLNKRFSMGRRQLRPLDTE